MRILKNHLHLTWVFFTLLQFVFIGLEEPYLFTIARILWIVSTFWVLHRKKRNWLWFIIPISVLFLSNDRDDGEIK